MLTFHLYFAKRLSLIFFMHKNSTTALKVAFYFNDDTTYKWGLYREDIQIGKEREREKYGMDGEMEGVRFQTCFLLRSCSAQVADSQLIGMSVISQD